MSVSAPRPFPEKLAEAEAWLKAKFAGMIRRVDANPWERAWLLEIPNGSGAPLKLKLVFPHAFPRDPMLVVWASADQKIRPHKHKCGALCLAPFSYKYEDIEGDLEKQLYSAGTLLQDYESAANDDQLLSEPLPYWEQYLDRRYQGGRKIKKARVHLACEPATDECTLLFGYRGEKGGWFLADSEDAAKELAINATRRCQESTRSIGVRIPIARPLHPDEFPTAWSDVYRLLEISGRFSEAADLLEAQRDADPWVALVFLYFDSPEVSYGVAIASERDNGLGKKALTKRPIKYRTMTEFLTNPHIGPLWLCPTARMDSSALFRRWAVETMPARHTARVLVAGCGSLGSLTVEELVRAGVRNITLVDNQFLDSENLCRHTLSMQYVGQNKADALKSHLERSMPLLDLESYAGSVASYLHQVAPSPDSFDIILAMTGESGPIWTLDSWRIQGRNAPAMVVSWAESFGVACHSALLAQGRSMQDIESNGARIHNMANWPEGSVDHLRPIPGCSATFQPLGRTKLLSIAAVSAQIVLEYLDDTNRISRVVSRIESAEAFRQHGADIKSAEFHTTTQGLSEGVWIRDLE